jgi:hypothetical protein
MKESHKQFMKNLKQSHKKVMGDILLTETAVRKKLKFKETQQRKKSVPLVAFCKPCKHPTAMDIIENRTLVVPNVDDGILSQVADSPVSYYPPPGHWIKRELPKRVLHYPVLHYHQ